MKKNLLLRFFVLAVLCIRGTCLSRLKTSVQSVVVLAIGYINIKIVHTKAVDPLLMPMDRNVVMCQRNIAKKCGK